MYFYQTIKIFLIFIGFFLILDQNFRKNHILAKKTY